MAEKFGWTLDYIDSLSYAELHSYDEYLIVFDANDKARAFFRAHK